MIDYLQSHPHIVVLLITLIVWGAIAGYLIRIDRKLQRLEQQFSTEQRENSSTVP